MSVFLQYSVEQDSFQVTSHSAIAPMCDVPGVEASILSATQLAAKRWHDAPKDVDMKAGVLTFDNFASQVCILSKSMTSCCTCFILEIHVSHCMDMNT